jgi:hypothetical protein
MIRQILLQRWHIESLEGRIVLSLDWRELENSSLEVSVREYGIKDGK